MKTLPRYLLFQIPSLAVVAIIALGLIETDVMSKSTGLLATGLWMLKDWVLYPFVKNAYEPDTSGSAADRLIGAVGTSCETIAPEGYVRIGAELWRCRSHDSAPIEASREVRVLTADGLTLTVEPLHDELVAPREAMRTQREH